MANISREDLLDLLDEFLAAMAADLPADFAAGGVGATQLQAKRTQYATLLNQARTEERQLRATEGEIDALRREVLQALVNIRAEVGIVEGRTSDVYRRLPKMPASRRSTKPEAAAPAVPGEQ